MLSKWYCAGLIYIKAWQWVLVALPDSLRVVELSGLAYIGEIDRS